MSVATLILGESGTGKSTALRNMDPNTTALIQVVKKPLPFKAVGWKPWHCANWAKIIETIHKAHTAGKDKVVIDDFQYLMSGEFMDRASQKGYEKFTEIADHAYRVLQAAANGPDGLRVYLLAHTSTDEFGNTRAKTIGKLMDDKIVLEGLFTIVLRTHVDLSSSQKYFFSTQNNGQDTVKSPIGMFADQLIPNDLSAVDAAVCDYYNITPLQPKAPQE